MRYEDDPRFRDYFLEDSYVLAIDEAQGEISFQLDAVLTPKHPEYIAPKANEQYCYRSASLRFRAVQKLEWKDKQLRKAVDASGQADYGNIDTFEILPNDVFRLRGDWGELEIIATEATLTLS